MKNQEEAVGSFKAAKELVDILESYNGDYKLKIHFSYDEEDNAVTHDLSVLDGDREVAGTEMDYVLETLGADLDDAYRIWLDTVYGELTSKLGALDLTYDEL